MGFGKTKKERLTGEITKALRDGSVQARDDAAEVPQTRL